MLDRESEEYLEKIPKLEVAININKRRLMSFGDFLEANTPSNLITEKEWAMFSTDE